MTLRSAILTAFFSLYVVLRNGFSKRDFHAKSNAALSFNHAHSSCSRTVVMASRGQRFGSIGSKIRVLATYDAFPAFSSKVRRLLYNPLGVLILAASAALVCGLYLNTQGFALFGGLLLVIVLGITWPRLSLLGLRGSISFDRSRSCEGERTNVRAIICNRLPWPAYGLAIAGGLGESDGPDDECPVAGVGIASAPGWRTVRCRWTFTPPIRGMYPLQRPSLRTGFPFGLWKSNQALSIAEPLVVWPRTYAVLPAPQFSADQQIEGSFSPHKVGMSGDVLGVRPYRRGDSLRRIHWSQTARHDRLIVCEFQANARPKIQLILDADPRAHLGSGSDGSREWAIRVVASLAKGWIEAGVEVGAAWHDVALHPGSGVAQLNLLDGLAKLPDSTERSSDLLESSDRLRDFDNGRVNHCDHRQDVAGGGVDVEEMRARWVVLQAPHFALTAALNRRHPVCRSGRIWIMILTAFLLSAVNRKGLGMIPVCPASCEG